LPLYTNNKKIKYSFKLCSWIFFVASNSNEKKIKITSGGLNHEPVDMSSHFNLPILNALWRVTVGDRFEYTDARLLDIVQRMGEFLSKIGNPSALLAITLPWLFKASKFPTY
jgi:hypothetical protein